MRYQLLLAVPLVTGWILIATGYILDKRAYARSKEADLAFVAQRKTTSERTIQTFIAIGILSLIVILWMIIFQK